MTSVLPILLSPGVRVDAVSRALLSGGFDLLTTNSRRARLGTFNEQVMSAREAVWWAPPDFQRDWVEDPELKLLGSEASEILALSLAASELSPEGPCLWVDPQLSLLVGFWRHFASVLDDRTVFIWADAEDAVSELAAIGIHRTHAQAVWEFNMVHALLGLVGQKALVLHAKSFFERPAQTANALLSFLEASIDDVDVASFGDVVAQVGRVTLDSDFSESALVEQAPDFCQRLADLATSLEGPHQTLREIKDLEISTGSTELIDARRAANRSARDASEGWKFADNAARNSAESHALAAYQSQIDQLVFARNRLAEGYNELAAIRADLEAQLQLRSEEVLRRSAEALGWLEALQLNDAHQTRLAEELRQAQEQLDNARAEITAVHQTKIFRYSAKLRTFYSIVRRGPRPTTGLHFDSTTPIPGVRPDYSTWIGLYDTLTEDDRASLHAQVAAIEDPPLVSVILPTYNTPEDYLRLAVASVRQQIYPHWELCIADDCSTDPRMGAVLDELVASDSRIKVVRRTENGHISAASNTALSMATGKWMACLDHDDELAEHALALMVLALIARPDAAMAYSDEDKLDADGNRHGPYFKPDFDPLLLLGQNYPCHLSLLRHDLVEQVGGYREDFVGSQDWDLILRVSELIDEDQVIHIPHVLYHWRVHDGSTASSLASKPYAASAGRRAVTEHLERQGRPGEVIGLPAFGWNRVKWALPENPPKVSIIIPTRNGHYLERCIDSIERFTVYPNYEMVVIDNGSDKRSTLEYLQICDLKGVKVIRDERPFNYAALNNEGVQRCDGDLVCLLNDDTEVVGGEWLNELVSQVLQPGVGAVGAKLYYDDGRIQHGGVVVGILGVAAHVHRLRDRLDPGYFGRLLLAQRFSALTAACVLVRREAWDQVGGLDAEHLSVAFNDIDICMRLGEAGWHLVWTPHAELIHHESATRGPDTEGERSIRFGGEIRYMRQRWGNRLRNDPAYNPNLTLEDEDFSLAWPPRIGITDVSPLP